MSGKIPETFRQFPCAEYFRDYTEGRYDTGAHLWFVLPFAEIHIGKWSNAFVIGRPGVNGIEFCYRRETDGIWAFYPIELRFERVANSLHELETGWINGSIAV